MQHQVCYETVLERIPVVQGVMARTMRTGEPVLLEEAHADPDFLDAVQGIVSEVRVPLVDEGEVLGTLNVEGTGGIALTENDLRLVEASGEHAGIALGRAKLHERVRESQERYRRLVETVQEGIAFVDTDERITYSNPAYAEVFGLTSEELAGRSLLEFLDEEQRRKVAEQTALRRRGESSSYELPIVAADGREKVLSASGSPITDADGDFEGAVHAVVDITERRKAEEALRESEERFRSLVQNASDMTRS